LVATKNENDDEQISWEHRDLVFIVYLSWVPLYKFQCLGSWNVTHDSDF
jgi:hypothetical protein